MVVTHVMMMTLMVWQLEKKRVDEHHCWHGKKLKDLMVGF